MKNMWRISMRKLLGTLLLVLIPQFAHAGPWMRDTGAGYAELSVGYFKSDGYFRASEQTQLNYSSYSLKLYSEVGLPGPFQAIVELPFVLATNTNDSDVAFRNNDFGDGKLSLEWSPWSDLTLVVGVDVTIPLYTPVAKQQLVGEFSASQNFFPELGDGNYDLTTRVNYGLALNFIPGWISGSAGYRKRFGYYVDGVDLELQMGVWLFPKKVYLSLYSNALLNLTQDPEPNLLTSRETVSLEVQLGITADPIAENLHMVFKWGELLYTRYAAPGYWLSLSFAYSWEAP